MSNKIVKLLSINKCATLIGSNGNSKLKYKSDTDLQENISDITPNQALKLFQNMYVKAKQIQGVYIVDFKSGVYKTVPVRWNYNTVMKGYQMIDNKTINLVDTFHDRENNVIKIDLLVYDKNEFHEYSCNYYVNSSSRDVHEVYKSLLIDVRKYFHKEKYMKLLKRIYSYVSIANNVDKAKELESFFNSNAGLLNQFAHKESVILKATENEEIDGELIENALHKLKNDIPNRYKSLVNISTLELLGEILQQDMNDEVIKFVEKL